MVHDPDLMSRFVFTGERHGTPAERLLAAQQRAKQAQQNRPHTLFATGPRQQPQPGPVVGNTQSGAGEDITLEQVYCCGYLPKRSKYLRLYNIYSMRLSRL